MTIVVAGERKKVTENNSDNKSVLLHEYGCELLLEKTTIEKTKDFSFPNDAYLIWYNIDNQIYLDLVRGTKVHIFDMYYDTYGSGAVQ